MTGQVSPKLRIHQQDWNICNVSELVHTVPSSEALGFETRARDTSDWNGRVDHFEVAESRLMLAKIEVCLTEGFESFIPANGGREDVVRRQWGRVIYSSGRSAEKLIESRTTFITFNKLYIDYTGVLICSMDLDWSLYFHGGIQTANRYRRRAILTFDKGVLDDASTRYEKGSSYDDGRKRLYWS